jgi:hypothetical protein
MDLVRGSAYRQGAVRMSTEPTTAAGRLAAEVSDEKHHRWAPFHRHDVRTVLAQHQQLLDALRVAQAGLGWYRDRFPQATDGSDDEAAAQIQAAIDVAEGR